jgi:GntR family transcriptional regulator/MocR family aminotransferase
LYSSRLAALRDGGHQYLGGLVKISDVRAGLYTVGFLENGMGSRQAERAASTHGIDVVALDRYSLDCPDPRGVLLGFAAFDEVSIKRSLRHLAAALDRKHALPIPGGRASSNKSS